MFHMYTTRRNLHDLSTLTVWNEPYELGILISSWRNFLHSTLN